MSYSIVSFHTVRCHNSCGFTSTSKYEYLAVDALFEHIKEKHVKTFEQLMKRGRKLATSQNGCGYWDDGKDGSGWDEAQQTFRDAWTESALKEKLGLGG